MKIVRFIERAQAWPESKEMHWNYGFGTRYGSRDEAISKEVTEENGFWIGFEYFSYYLMRWLLKAVGCI